MICTDFTYGVDIRAHCAASRYRNILEVSSLGRGPSEQELVSPYYEKINDYVYDTVQPHYEFEEHTILHKTPVRKFYFGMDIEDTAHNMIVS